LLKGDPGAVGFAADEEAIASSSKGEIEKLVRLLLQ
jgi:hypothetical protein